MSSLPVRHLHQFRAGRLIKRQNADGKEILAPDTTKGLIRVILDDEDLVRFQWIERSSAGDAIGDPVIDVVIFPHEATFEKVIYIACMILHAHAWMVSHTLAYTRKHIQVDRPGGSRVFTLAFPTDASDRNLFFWAQEPSTDRDSDDVDSINNGLNTIVDGTCLFWPQHPSPSISFHSFDNYTLIDRYECRTRKPTTVTTTTTTNINVHWC